MKRIISIMLALLLLLSAVPAGAEQSALVVGNPTPMRGEFFTDMWGNATSDIDVRDLLHGCNLICWDEAEGQFTADPSVVSGVKMIPESNGDHTYRLTLCHDLYYSDGSRITARDYAFSYLFSISPVLEQLGAAPLRREQIAGYQKYMEGNAPLAGVRVLAEDLLSVTLDHRYLPFFYEMGLLYCNPYPISVIAPGVEVRDDGQGVYLANQDPSLAEPAFNAELLRKTILDPETGYQSHPAVVSGPYMLTKWDGVTAEFELNSRYKGNSRGEKPSIQRLTYTLADNDTMVQKLRDGEFGLLNKVMRADAVQDGMTLSMEGSFSMSNYFRIGLSFISFACERPTVSSQAVRQAIAYCFDREKATADYIGPFGRRVDGYYGLGQWMYSVATGTKKLPGVVQTDAKGLTLENLNPYEVDLDRAAALLEGDGWTLNQEGLREKDGVKLDLRLIYPEGNNIFQSLQANLAENLQAVGIRLTLEAVPMGELLTRWYRQGERGEDMIFLASNFDLIFDPSVHFSPDGAWSYTNLRDEALYQAAVAMRTTEPGDTMGYMRRWVAFQERFNEALPMIPVYSNLYFDFWRNDLQGYQIVENTTWGEAIVGARLQTE